MTDPAATGGLRRLDPGGDARGALEREGMAPSPWSCGPATPFAPHRHPRTKHLYVLDGSIEFWGPTFARLELAEGDGIEIPAGTEHSALAGRAGVSCVEGFAAG